MFKLQLRNRFDLLKPNLESDVNKNQFRQKVNKNGKRNCDFIISEKVFIKDPRRNIKERSEAIVIKKLSPVTYEVQFDDNVISKKHVNQMIKSKVTATFKRGEYDTHTNIRETLTEPRRSERIKNKKSEQQKL